MISTGLLPAEGTFSNKGLKNSDSKKKNPHTTVLSPVLAPALIDADDSGDTKIGAELMKPLSIVSKPHITKIQRPRGKELSSRFNPAPLLRVVTIPLRYNKYKKMRSAVKRGISLFLSTAVVKVST
mmetsp:Transcript_9203/g.12593  ORF Transcript_9203/g.12593 Transcript_9203/m.12593 type:complete len:126 (-) Transcript_9203:160-537(-)